VATYDKRGSHIYTGNSKGKILIVSNLREEGKDFKVNIHVSFSRQN
jgi:hypothetical protein